MFIPRDMKVERVNCFSGKHQVQAQRNRLWDGTATGPSVFNLSVSAPLPARLEGLGPLKEKQKQKQKQT